MLSGQRQRWAALIGVASLLALLPSAAGAGILDPVNDELREQTGCGADAATPYVANGFVYGYGEFGCESGDLVGVSVCLIYGVAEVACGTDEGYGEASATPKFLCLPGIWYTVAIGNGGAGGDTSYPLFVTDVRTCDPLTPQEEPEGDDEEGGG